MKKVICSKLIITHPEHGHLELDTTRDIKREFEKIMREGYGNNIPAIFHATRNDGTVVVKKGAEAQDLIYDPQVREITVITPMAGG